MRPPKNEVKPRKDMPAFTHRILFISPLSSRGSGNHREATVSQRRTYEFRFCYIYIMTNRSKTPRVPISRALCEKWEESQSAPSLPDVRLRHHSRGCPILRRFCEGWEAHRQHRRYPKNSVPDVKDEKPVSGRTTDNSLP